MAPNDLTPAQVRRWRQILNDGPVPANAFLDPAFTLVTSTVREDVRVAVVTENGSETGFFAYEPHSLRRARPVGSGVSDNQAFVRSPRCSLDLPAVLRGCGLLTWSFDHGPTEDSALLPHMTSTSPSPVMDLERGFDDYLARRGDGSRKLNKTINNLTRRMEREHGPLVFQSSTIDRDVLEQLRRWKSAQYRRTLAPDVLAQEWVRDLHDELLRRSDEDLGLRLSALYAGDRLVAAHLGLETPRMMASWFPAYDIEFQKFSPGTMLYLRMAQDAASRGLHYIDLGRGDSPYKRRLQTSELTVGRGAVAASPLVQVLVSRAGRSRVAMRRKLDASPALKARAKAARHRVTAMSRDGRHR
jgi:CelD/BcsL family acetyltransferase involved in cellulose biosynthesis